MIKAGIVGLGRWGQRLVESVGGRQSSPGGGIEFVKAVARTPQKAQDFCARHGLPVSSDYDGLLSDPQVDAVVLATPHSQHVDQIRAAAAAGKHVFVEKPVALDLAGARAAVDACGAAKVVLAVGFNRRFLPAFQRMSERLEQGAVGRALHIEGNFSGPFGFSYRPGMWRGSPDENPAGGMTAMGIHVIDAMIRLMGPVAAVQAVSRRQILDADIDDTTAVMLRFHSGSTGVLSTLMATAPTWRLQLYGSKAWVSMHGPETLEERTLDGDVTVTQFPPVDIERRELEAFADAIRGGPDFPVTRHEILSGISVLEAVVGSTRSDGALRKTEKV